MLRTRCAATSDASRTASSDAGGLLGAGRWEGTDFTRPTGPVTSTEFLGRLAYAVELAPPSHKPAPLHLVVDAATGIVLRSTNGHFGFVEEWTRVEIGVELADDLFVWDGPATPAPIRAERDAEHEADMAGRRGWLDARGLAELAIPAEPELVLNAWDDASGAFFVSLEFGSSGALVRRPQSTEPWPQVDTMRYAHSYRWRDRQWDWCLAGDFAVSDEQLALLKVRLATTT